MTEEIVEIEFLQARVVDSLEELQEHLGSTLAAFELTLRVPNDAKIQLARFVALPIHDEPDLDARQMRVFVGLELNPPRGVVHIRERIEEETEASE